MSGATWESTMLVHIITKPHSEQRYDTVGDWMFGEDGTLTIYVSRLESIKSGQPTSGYYQEACVALHEFVEAVLCRRAGITTEDVDKFDKQYEKSARMQTESEEPGDHPLCPYRNQHNAAMGIERMFAAMLNISWQDYENNLSKLSDNYEDKESENK